MRSAKYAGWVVIIFSVSCSILSATPARNHAANDLISGQWDATFHAGGQSAQLTLELKLEGHKVTGTVNSQHTGPGTISKGSLDNNKLSMTFDFAKHESMIVTGTLKDGTLSGEFRTEGFTDKWEATRKGHQ